MNEVDWPAISGGIVAILTVIGAVWAKMTGKLEKKPEEEKHDDREELRNRRDRDSNENTSITLENTWRLVNELQQDRKELKEGLAESTRHCTERINTLEEDNRTLKRTVANLEADVRVLRAKVLRETV